jgi:hypothetical protein
MSLGLKTWLISAFLFTLPGAPAFAQSNEFLPEVNGHLTANSFLHVYLQAQDDRDAGTSDQFSIGPSAQFYLKPLVRLKEITAFDLDDSKPRPLVLESGYRYITAPDTLPTNRMETVLTTHFPLKAGFLISDRNRADLDWKGGGFTWRYRNKLTVERTFAVYSYHLIPYLAAEPFYVDQYHKWSSTDLYAGCLFPVGKHVQFDSYYEHQNNTGKHPNKQQNDFGLTLNVFYSLVKR